MLERFRQFWTNVWSPIGDLLLRLGVSPNTVTLVGTLGVVAGALVFFPRGWLLAGGLAMYYVGPGDNRWWTALAIYCLSMGSVTSYARARAESLGMQAKVGIAERADRLVLILAAVGLADLLRLLGVDDRVMWLIPIALALLAVASTITVVQRILVVRRQALALGSTPAE